MTGELSQNFYGVGMGPLSKILAVKFIAMVALLHIVCFTKEGSLVMSAGICLIGTGNDCY